MSREDKFEFKGSLNDFLDAAHRPPRQENGDRQPLSGPPHGPASDTAELLLNLRIGKDQFGKEAFAILLNPIDLFKMEQEWTETRGLYGRDLFTEAGEGRRVHYEGLMCQPALFITEGTYTIVGKADYDKLIEQNKGKVK